MKALSDLVWANVLSCCQCHGALTRLPAGARCEQCGTEFPVSSGGAIDLRLQQPRTTSIEFTSGTPLVRPGFEFKPLPLRSPAEVDFSGANTPWHLTPELLSHIPRAQSPTQIALDLGCGSGLHRDTCEKAGFHWLGMDYGNEAAPMLADAHALPFKDNSIDFVLSMAVLEHIQYPFVVAREVLRVLKPGALYIGTVSFLEPFHGDSYYHHTHLGTYNTLVTGGLQVEYVAPAVEWSGLRAQAAMGLFPRAPEFMGRALVWPIEALHKLWWAAGRVASNASSENFRLLKTTGAYQFIARKPLA